MVNLLKNNACNAWQLMQQAQKITFLTHYNPDADGVSACAALAHVLQKFGKSVEGIYPTKLETKLKRQPNPVYINQHIQTPDLLIMCDTANYKRLYYPEAFSTIPSINIDHHISNDIQATINIVEANVSSTCELMYFLLKEWDSTSIDTYVAEALLMGMLYDTQVFRIPSTTSTTLRVAADLIDLGANLYDLQNELLRNKNTAKVSLWGKLLSNIQRSPDGKAAWTIVTQDLLRATGTDFSCTEGLINFLAQLSDTDISILFCETEDGKTKISLRSQEADVNAFAKQFGGGGHTRASGILTDMPINEAVMRITKAL